MSRDLRRITLLGIVFLVLLRMCIGWQFLYEGLWKLESQSTANPWSAKGYLINAQGPFRSYFRSMVDDPDDLNWLDYEYMLSEWEEWKKDFTDHYELSDEQKKTLDELFNGRDTYEVALSRMPESAPDINRNYGPTIPKIIGFRPGEEPGEPGTLYVKEGQEYKPEHVVRMEGVIKKGKQEFTETEQEFLDAIDALYAKFTSTSKVYPQVLENWLVKDKGLTGEPTLDAEGNVVEKPPGEIVVYKAMLDEYEEDLANADRESNFAHLKTIWGKIQEKRAELVNPIKELDAELKAEAYKMLTAEQRQKPPLPEDESAVAAKDRQVIWILIILGVLLIAGCFTRVAAILGAGMVLMFYLAQPPWPGVPPAPGPEHSLIVNKNLIEVVALLALASLPSGSWFGVDGIFGRLFLREKSRSTANTTTTAKKDEKKPVPAKA